jgi:hypothetical protein
MTGNPQPGSDHIRPASGHVRHIGPLKPQAGEPQLTKTSHNAFTTTNLQQLLTQHGITEVIVCGIRAEQCCETTARVAFDLGYHVTFVTEATATSPIAQRDAPTGQTVEQVDLGRGRPAPGFRTDRPAGSNRDSRKSCRPAAGVTAQRWQPGPEKRLGFPATVQRLAGFAAGADAELGEHFARCHSTVWTPMNSCAPISGLVRPSRANWATSSSCGVSPVPVSSARLRTFSPVAWSSRRVRSAKASAPMDANASNAGRSWFRASIRRSSRRSHSP